MNGIQVFTEYTQVYPLFVAVDFSVSVHKDIYLIALVYVLVYQARVLKC